MKQGHPLRRLIRVSDTKLSELSNQTYDIAEQLIDDSSYYNVQKQRSLISSYCDYSGSMLHTLVSSCSTIAIEDTIKDLEITYGIDLREDKRLELTTKIELRLRETFEGSDILKRIHRSKVILRTSLVNLLNGQLSSLKMEFNNPAYGWSRKILITEMLRAYHYTVQEFALMTRAKSIEVVLYKEHHKDDEVLGPFEGKYKPNSLPDYPRPMAEYLLKLKY